MSQSKREEPVETDVPRYITLTIDMDMMVREQESKDIDELSKR